MPHLIPPPPHSKASLSLYKPSSPQPFPSLYNHHFLNPIKPPPPPHRRRKPPLQMAYYYSGCEHDDYKPHFLDSCSLCGRSLNHNSDIFMYRGDTPFCSQECRQEQIEMDEAAEKRWKISSKRSNKSRQTSDSAIESDTNKAVRTGTVAVS